MKRHCLNTPSSNVIMAELFKNLEYQNQIPMSLLLKNFNWISQSSMERGEKLVGKSIIYIYIYIYIYI